MSIPQPGKSAQLFRTAMFALELALRVLALRLPCAYMLALCVQSEIPQPASCEGPETTTAQSAAKAAQRLVQQPRAPRHTFFLRKT